MRKTFKKIAAAVMAVTSLAVGMVGMSVSAAAQDETVEAPKIIENNISIALNQDSDSYSVFNWGRSGSTVAVRLTAKSGTRYGQVSCYGYNSKGEYVGHIGNESILYATNASKKSVEKQSSLSAYSYTFYGYLYLTGQPIGNYLSSWIK